MVSKVMPAAISGACVSGMPGALIHDLYFCGSRTASFCVINSAVLIGFMQALFF